MCSFKSELKLHRLQLYKIKVKFSLAQATKAQRESRGTALRFL